MQYRGNRWFQAHSLSPPVAMMRVSKEELTMADETEIIDIEPVLTDPHSKTLFDRVSDYLTEKDWNFSSFPEKEYFTLALRLEHGTVHVQIDVAESPAWSRVVVYSTYSTFVPVNRRPVALEAINRVNYSFLCGNFEMDMRDGEIRVRVNLESDTYVSEPMIDRAVRRCLDLANSYQAALLAVAFGNTGPENILELADRGEKETLQ
jgi:hypothetical protein